jgi:hypothetical protein
MTATNSFFDWFYNGLNGLGGWLIFLLLALIAVIWVFYDSGTRRLPAVGWRMGVALSAALLLPAIVYRFTMSDPASPLANYSEIIFYLGILGGILPVVLAVGYYVTYQGMVGCPQGHVYEAALGQCPYDAPPPVAAPVVVAASSNVAYPPLEQASAASPVPPPVRKRHVHAWLVTAGGEDYQLCEHETTIGRSQQNDIYLAGDSTIGRQHAKIVEQNGHFKLYDLGSKNFTRVNGHIVRGSELLQPDDEIQFGDHTVVHFVTARH